MWLTSIDIVKHFVMFLLRFCVCLFFIVFVGGVVVVCGVLLMVKENL